ncbi:MAG: hypothetical protein IPI89_09185 [Propionivibrio sp.]|nr:hypothetical protein [Propionivibrio sp.]
MRKLFVALLLSYSSLALAAVLNIEFNFTPFVGEPAKADHVETIPGKAAVFINNIPVAEQEVRKNTVPVLFDNREIAAAVWVPAGSMGPALRKGKNTIRIEFVPANAKASYDAQLRWASVTDQVTRTEKGPGQVTSTNQSDEGRDSKKAVGKVVFEREFVADFATDRPWHHFPPVTALTDADRQDLAAMVAARAEAFKPDFSTLYRVLETAATPGMQLDLGGIRKAKILDKGYKAGLRVAAPAADTLDFVLTGNPEVLIRSKTGRPLFQIDPKAFGRIKGDELQMGLAMVLGVLYPQQLVAVRDAAGKWAAVY